MPAPDIGRLLVACPDRPGIVAAASRFLFERGANIIESDQYSTDPHDGTFFLRTVFALENLAAVRQELHDGFAAEVAEPFGMDWQLTDAGVPKRVAILVSRYDHCLVDLLWRARRGELPLEFGVVISNHPDLGDEVRRFGVPFVHIPVTRETRAEAEERQLELLAGSYDLVVMARYMQILSAHFLRHGRRTGHQHPPLVPARVRRRRPLCAGARARREAHRRHRALRDDRPG
jgi:formyltetrahydrofolate deformylase